jgi:hypothetical protein
LLPIIGLPFPKVHGCFGLQLWSRSLHLLICSEIPSTWVIRVNGHLPALVFKWIIFGCLPIVYIIVNY